MRAPTLFAIAAALSLAACTEDGAPMASGERLAEGRDFTEAWFWRPGSLVYLREAASGSGWEDMWVRERDEAEPRLAFADIVWSDGQWPRARVGQLLVMGLDERFAYDLDAHVSERLPSSRIMLRPDGGALVRWGGDLLPEHVLRVGPLGAAWDITGFVTRAVDFMGADLAALGHRTQDPDGEQVLARVSPADGTVTVLLAGLAPWMRKPLVADAVADGCGWLSLQPCPLFRVLGCDEAAPVCAETGERPCAIVFTRDVPEAMPVQLQPTVFDVNLAMELPLEGAVSTASNGFFRSPDARRVAWIDGGTLRVWDACTRRALRCELGAGLEAVITADAWRPDSGAVTITAAGQKLLVMSADDGGCVSSDIDGLRRLLYSPGGERMGWIDLPAVETNRTLWVADGRGQGAVPLASGQVIHGGFSDDARFAFVQRLRQETVPLGVIDLAAATSTERPIASATSFDIALGARRLVALTRWNSQDQAGQVEVFDLARGTSTVLAESVTELAAAGPVDGAVDIAYVVRARYPSASDGLWRVTLPAADPP